MKNCIRNYRRVANWENFFLDSAIYSIAECLGVKYDNGFTPIAAITGDLFTYMYADAIPCDSGLTNYVVMPDRVRKAFESFGCCCEYLSKEEINRDISSALQKICASVDRGLPALAWGVGGVPGMHQSVPMGEGALIGGYDDDVLLIHLYCGGERLPAESYGGRPGVDEYGYTAILAIEVLAGTDGVFIPNQKVSPTDPRIVCHDVLVNIPRWLTLSPTGGRVSKTDQYVFGKTAFTRWAEVLLEDAVWQECNEASIWDKHCSAFCSLCTSTGSFVGDSRVVDWLRRAAAVCPELTVISKLLPLYENMSALWQRIWDIQGGFMPTAEKMQEHEYRAEIRAVLQRMGDCCDTILKIFGEGANHF